MHNFFKKRSSSQQGTGTPAKRVKPDVPQAEQPNLPDTPRVIVAWNCNGLTSRLRALDARDIKAFVAHHRPDVLFLSEVRVGAANNSATGKPGPHTKWYRSRMRESDKKLVADVALVNAFLFSCELRAYKVYLSLADTKYAGTAMLVNTETVQLPKRVRYNLDVGEVKGAVHDAEGRVIFAEFGGLAILHTYSPNNGWDETHFQRRRKWDERMRLFMLKMKERKIPIMWVGDLNVAPTDADLSHPTYFRRQTDGRRNRHKGPAPPVKPCDVGQPGCTDGERARFWQILRDGELVDAYRTHVGENERGGLTWRGMANGKHAGRGMRIDHCIVSKRGVGGVRAVEVMGDGADLVGFLGSDHCPVMVRWGGGEEGVGSGEEGGRNGEEGDVDESRGVVDVDADAEASSEGVVEGVGDGG